MEQNVSNGSALVRPRIKNEYTTAYTVALILLSFFIFLVNSIVLYLFSTRDSLRTKTNMILASLACSDLINGVVAIPFQISCTEHRSVRSLRLASMVFYRLIAASTMFHILAVTLERHICVLYPLRYNSLVTKRRVIATLSAIWIVSTFYAVIGLSWLGLANEFNHLKQPPKLSTSRILQFEFAYTIAGFVLCFLIPLVMMCYSFPTILREISRHNRRESELMLESETAEGRGARVQLDSKPVLIFMGMLLLFAASWSTWYIQMFILSAAPHYYKNLGGTLTDYLRSTTSLINPLLYSLIKKDFRLALRKFLLQVKSRLLTGFRLTGRKIKTEKETTLRSLDTAC